MVEIKKVSTGAKPFILERRKAKLVFTDTEYEGLEIMAKLDVSVSVFLELQALARTEEPAELKAAFKKFGDEILLSWNMEDENGDSIKANSEGFLSLPPVVATEILKAWSEAVGGTGED
tara:strand:- start:985 stop:1341 length:357 start_codon:yes stop_codon:yes gene_type:complete